MKDVIKINCKAGLFVGALFLVVASAQAQNEWKNWNNAQVNLSFTKKLDLRFSHLRTFNITHGFGNEFNQSSVQLRYNLTKKADIAAGYTFTGFNSLDDGGSRFFARIGYKVRLVRVLNWSNSLQGEIHSTSETRYHYRVIYSTRLSPKKRFNFLNLSPSLSYSLYYNIGGKPIQYYDNKTGTPAVRQTPDGFHRGRLLFNLNSKVTKNLSFSIYCMMQREFNLFSPEYRKINIVKPVTGKVVRAFDNFNVLGLTFQYDIDLYPTQKKME